jgi:hypothetical protein
MWDWEGGGAVAVLRVHVADWEQLQILKLKLGEGVLNGSSRAMQSGEDSVRVEIHMRTTCNYNTEG